MSQLTPTDPAHRSGPTVASVQDSLETDQRIERIRARVQSRTAASPRFGAVAAISALLLSGMLFGASLWVLAAVAAALLVGANFLLAKSWAEATKASRSGGDAEVKVGSQVRVELALTNSGRIPVLWLLAEDLLPQWATRSESPTIRIQGQRVGVLMLRGGETKKLKYVVDCHRRGYIQIGPTVLETGDLMGLYRRYRVGTQPQFITVLPDVVPLAAYEIGSRRPIGEIRMRENIMDDPTRLRGIRQWQPGDPMRSVHWAATARTGTLHTKVYEPSSIIGATLVLDFHEQTTPARHEPVRSDLAVTMAASIATALHDQNEPVGLVTNARDAADRIRSEGWVGDHRVRDAATKAAGMQSDSDRLQPVIHPANRGPVHLREILRTLARLERTDGLTLTELVVECESQLASDTTILVIAQQLSEPSIAALIGLARRGRAVAVIINTQDINDFSELAGPLISVNVPVFHLASSAAIAEVCRRTLLR